MIYLYLGWHRSSFLERRREFEYCLGCNVGLDKINKIFLFLEDGTYPNISSSKITYIKTNKRMTYYDYFKFINRRDNLKDTINVISNSDIIFDNTIEKVNEIPLFMRCIALSRHNFDMFKQKHITGSQHEGQDVWIFKGHIENIKQMDCDFYLGRAGCDLRMNHELHMSGYSIANISSDVKIYHVHRSKSKNTYRKLDPIDGPYIRISKTSISDWR